MARGWESKSVESQIEDAESRSGSPKRRLSLEQTERQKKLDGLLLSRTRVLHDLDAVRNQRYRAQLEAALAHLDREIASLGAAGEGDADGSERAG